MALAAALAVAAACSHDATPLARAHDIVDDDGGFGTPTEAGDSFAHAAELLLDGYPETSAWLQVVAVEVLDCRQPDVYDARQDVLRQLDDPTQPLPALPDC